MTIPSTTEALSPGTASTDKQKTEALTPGTISTDKKKRHRRPNKQQLASKRSLRTTAHAIEQMQAEAEEVSVGWLLGQVRSGTWVRALRTIVFSMDFKGVVTIEI